MEYKTKFDKEYSTQYIKEVSFLKNHGINYVFSKKINGITTYKYEKNKELFCVLAEFYSK